MYLCSRLGHGFNCPNFPTKAIWKSKAPIKIAWAAFEGKIPMDDMLKS